MGLQQYTKARCDIGKFTHLAYVSLTSGLGFVSSQDLVNITANTQLTSEKYSILDERLQCMCTVGLAPRSEQDRVVA